MAFDFDVYLLGPAQGVSREQLLDGLRSLFGDLPEEFLQSVGVQPLRIKAAVDLDLAQRFVDSIKGVGGQVEMVRAGASPPGAKPIAAKATGGVGSYAGARGQRVVHRRAGRSPATPTGPQPTTGAVSGADGSTTGAFPAGAEESSAVAPLPTASSPTPPHPGSPAASPQFHPGLPTPVMPVPEAQAPISPGLPSEQTAGEAGWPHGDAADPYGQAGAFVPASVGGVHEDEGAELAAVEILEVPQVYIELEPIHPNHPLRGPEHLAAMHPLTKLSSVAAPFDAELSLGVLGDDLDPVIAQYIAKHLHLSELIELYFAEPSESPVQGVAGVVITARSVAWREAKIPLSRLESVAVQCDVQERLYAEVSAGGETFVLPILEALPTLLLAETLARVSPRRQLWVGPRATRRLRAELTPMLSRFTRTALSRNDGGDPARRAIRMVRYYYDMVQRLHDHWEQAPAARWGSPKQVPMDAITATVTAPEFLEIHDRLGNEQDVLIREMLVGAQKVLSGNEGILALFEFREPRWAPPLELDEVQRGAFLLLRYGLASEKELRNASQESYLLGTHGVLTDQRLVFVRPGNASAVADISLGKIEDIAVQEGPAPRLHIKYLGTFDRRHTLRYCVSGNYLFPIPGSPLEQVQRLAARILEAQERFWETQQPSVNEAAKLPAPPAWLGEALAQIPRSRSERLNAAVIALMRDPATPREVRRVATVGQGIQLSALRGLRERAAEHKVPLAGLGERVLHLPGELFDRLDDGILVAEEGILVSGLGTGRMGYNEVLRIETVRDGSWTAALFGGLREDVGIRSKDDEVMLWLGTLVSTLVHAANI